MKNAIALLFVVLFGAACAPEAPAYFSIDERFSPAERETIRAAVEAWGVELHEDFGLVLFSEQAHFELVPDLLEDADTERACPPGFECSVNGKENSGNIRIAENRRPGLDVLWRIAAHEFGHLCIDNHPPGSALMAAAQDHEGSLEIDAGAVRLWREGCH